MQQTPAPGQHRLAFCGDLVEFTLRLPGAARGEARLRTNIGHATTARAEIIAESLERRSRLAEDWFDIPMTRVSDTLFRLVLPLVEVGHFEAKTFFLPEGEDTPRWPEGANTTLNVHPAAYVGANTLYNAFVRQFGQGPRAGRAATPVLKKSLATLDKHGYHTLPPSGTFRDLIRELDFIIGRLHCRILMLLPIHPTPTVYGKMGRFGSPYAALDFTDVDPALAEFDERATPLEQFQELTDAVHAREAKLLLDIAINHTGWAATLHSHHPDWLKRAPDGTIRSPGAWGVVWEDLTELDHQNRALWSYLAEVFLTWCRRGVDGFRCDAGYMIPLPAWEYIAAVVRREFPDTLFLLEGLGGPVETTRALLNTATLNWAYSELFQNIDRRQVETYLPFALDVSATDGLMVHFAETHDNPRLAARSLVHARLRTALAALGAPHGAFAFANGVEWFAREKIDVHERRSLNWGSRVNQVDRIARLTAILRTHPAFGPGVAIRLIHCPEGSGIALVRRCADGQGVLVAANLDDTAPGSVRWKTDDAGFRTDAFTDLLSGAERRVTRAGDTAALKLTAGEVVCLTPDAEALRPVLASERDPAAIPARVRRQGLRVKALEVVQVWRGMGDYADLDVEQLADELAADPFAFCRRFSRYKTGSTSCTDTGEVEPTLRRLSSGEPNVVTWHWPRDVRRETMLPPRHFLLIRAAHPFRARLEESGRVLRQEDALRQTDGRYFVLLPPLPDTPGARTLTLCVAVYAPDDATHVEAPLLALPATDGTRLPMRLMRHAILDGHHLLLDTNGRGGMLRAPVIWGALRSRYDALLAGNLHPEHPEERRIMLTRCRAWLVFQGYSQDITVDRLLEFQHVATGGGCWRFRVPFGHGQSVRFEIEARMVPDRNAILLRFRRLPADRSGDFLADAHPVTLILRPDIEDRGHHEVTKAYQGPEHAWPRAIQPELRGFLFAPDPARRLLLRASAGGFQVEPEWQYMVHRPLEAERGLDPDSDLFSPGYFKLTLTGGETADVLAQILTPQEPDALALPIAASGEPPAETATRSPTEVLEQALRAYVVRRGALKTVIAGYPWFLDWGRDTLIAARGLIAAGLRDEVKAILRQFAQFEQDGTLPNMMQGDNATNRDTSDAPLWFLVACADWQRATPRSGWLDESCGRRPLRRILEAIAHGYRRGTPNGIRMDEASGLIFSPAHFTWMDTNHPAGTPREGYPLEIQALWHAALVFLAELDGGGDWRALADRVRASLLRHYWDAGRGYMADCLHARPGVPAAKATPDDALRPNQLLALTLGAVDDADIGGAVLTACEELLVPGAIRSLADRPVEYPLPIERHGRLLNNPQQPYCGRYEGDEDTRRKPAYHNGTAWTWLYPSYAEAWLRVYGPAAKPTARAWLAGGMRLLHRGCLGHIPEILDGDAPHTLRGCDAQAWGVTELYRVWRQLESR